MRPVKSVKGIKDALGDPERGRELYDDYYGLWHLAAMGVIDVEATPGGVGWKVKDVIWRDEGLSAEPARIALIDTGVADHPNLRHRILWDEAIDFGTRDAGAFYIRGDHSGGITDSTEQPQALTGIAAEADLKRVINGLGLAQYLRKGVEALLLERVRHGGRKRMLSFQDQRYPSHGTTAAGLAVGTPLLIGGKVGPGTLPFFGVDPMSVIIPVATSPEPEPGQLILALVYALANGADVILMPRGADNPARAPRRDPRRKGFAVTRYDTLARQWELFEAVLKAVSKRIPVICAAGNSGDRAIEYPASLAASDNGIIAVGAVTAAGRRSGYGCYGKGLFDEGVTIVAPSNDFRVYTRHEIRLDPQAPQAIDHNWLIHDLPGEAYVEYANEAPFSIDIPGPRGYSGGGQVRPGGEADLESLYTLFGGTSAASCQVAGVVALMRRSARHYEGKQRTLNKGKGWNGTFVKKALAASGVGEIFGNPLRPNRANDGDLGMADRDLWPLQFGAGLISAKKAIQAVRKA